MSSENAFAALEGTLIFRGLPEDEAEGLFARLQLRTFRAGANLMESGQDSPGLYVMRTGLVAALARDASGQEREVGTLGQGECVGEMALLTGEPCSATVRAVVDTEVWVLRPEDFAETMERSPILWRNLSRILSQRLARTSRRLASRLNANITTLITDCPDDDASALAIAAVASVARQTGKPALLLDGRQISGNPISKVSQTSLSPSLAAVVRDHALLSQHDIPLDPDNGVSGARISVLETEDEQAIDVEHMLEVLDRLSSFYGQIVILMPRKASELRQQLFERGRAIGAVVRGDGVERVPYWIEEICAIQEARSRLDVAVMTGDLPDRSVIQAIEDTTTRPVRRLGIARAALQEMLRERRFVPRDEEGGIWEAIDRLGRQIAGVEVGLALGAGAAKGFAHIGVLDVLRSEKVPIDYIVGTSIGAIVGATYAGGMALNEIEGLLQGADRKLVRWTLPFRSVWSDKGLMKLLRDPAPKARFYDLDVPFAAVATDVATGREMILRRGIVWKAVQASVTVPGIFPPALRRGRHLVDGGLVNPVPGQTVRDLGANIVIAVDLMSPSARMHERSDVPDATSEAIKTRIPNLVEMLWRSNEIMQEEVTLRSAATADATIEPKLGRVRWSDFSKRGHEYRQAGAEAAREKMPEIRGLVTRALPEQPVRAI